MRPARVNRVLGMNLSAADQVRALERLDGLTAVEEDGIVRVTVPSYRPDLAGEHDLIEEIARLIGYEAIPATMPSMTMAPLNPLPALDLDRRLRERMAALGFNEVVLTNFEDPQLLSSFRLQEGDPRLRAVKLQNPLAQNESILRTTLLPKLLLCLKQNRHKGATGPLHLMEFGAAFEETGEVLPRQRRLLAGLIAPALEKTLWARPPEVEGFYELKAVVEHILAAIRFPGARIEPDPDPEPYLHPGKCGRVMVGAAVAGRLGQLHPDVIETLELADPEVFLFEMISDMLYEHADWRPKAQPVSKFPPTLRDLAVVVEEDVAMSDILRAAGRMKSAILESLTLFDVFRGGTVPAGKKSMAFHVRYQSLERTLTDDEVNREHQRLAEELKRKVKAVLR
jgi:phenylalanyl-tRNA synthetase beta chain